MTFVDEVKRHDVLVPTDNPFQRRARLLQALWREEKGLPIGEHRGRTLGSRLPMPSAKNDLANYLKDTIRNVVRREVLDRKRSAGKLYAKPRIFNDVLSSQPLCFNLFGELQQDLQLATRALRSMTGGRIDEVKAIGFEHSPGPGDPRYTGDRSALDAFVEYTTPRGTRGFAGIEVKYHESLADKPTPHRARYDVVARKMGCFEDAAVSRLKAKPLQQIWRDHLLVGSLRLDETQGYADAFFAFLYPKDNDCCSRAVASYRECLRDDTSFTAWTLEAIVDAIRAAGAGAWIDTLAARYLAFDVIGRK